MDALTLSAVCLLRSIQPDTAVALVGAYVPYIEEASRRFAIPRSWITAVICAESGGRTWWHGGPITSPAGAMGLMQVMPQTYQALATRYGLGTDPYDPHDNILAGAGYLREMYARYGYPQLFAAYNAGPGRLDALLLRGQALPEATIAYVNTIIPATNGALWADDRASNHRPGLRKPQVTSVESEANGALFFTLRATTTTATSADEPRGPASPPWGTLGRAPTPASLFVPLHTSAR